MKILQLVTKRQYRGAEVFAANLSVELIKLGHDIVFAGLYLNKENILDVANADNRDLVATVKGPFSLKLYRELIKLIKETKPDVIQCNGSDTLKYSYLASFVFPSVPIVYRNISMISEWMGQGSKKKLYNLIFKRIWHVSSVGDEAIEDLIETFKYPRNKTSVIRRGIPLTNVDANTERQKLLTSIGVNPDCKLVLHVGNFSPEKNHFFLLDIFEDIKKEFSNIKLILIGEGILLKEVKELIKSKELEDTVFALGFRKDIPQLLSSADCFVLASKVEGVPGVILEAGAQKVPSVATNVGGTSEVLINNETGFIIENFNKSEFKSKILEIVNDLGLQSKLGENAYNLVLSEFNPENNARKFEKLYEKLRQQK